MVAEAALFQILQEDCTQATHEIHTILRSLDPAFANLSKDFIYRTYEKYNYTFKNTSLKNKLKFLAENVRCVRVGVSRVVSRCLTATPVGMRCIPI